MIDTTDGPMYVEAYPRATAGAPSRPGAVGGALCTTPCAADLPVGHYQLFLRAAQGESGDVDDLSVREGINHYLRAPGRYNQPTFTDRLAPFGLLYVGTDSLRSCSSPASSSRAVRRASPGAPT